MKNYDWILFDADETLFHFDSFSGLQLMFSRLGVSFTHEHYSEYQTTNKALWVEYQNGRITALQLQHQRFDHWGLQLEISPHELNSSFMMAMAEICKPLEGAAHLLETLHGKSKLGIITNGFTELQQIRLEKTGFKKYFDILVISEEVGVAKPHPAIFDRAFSLMGNPPKENVLMVGDTPESDILGGINAGIDTCWLKGESKSLPVGIEPKYQVSSLQELRQLYLES